MTNIRGIVTVVIFSQTAWPLLYLSTKNDASATSLTQTSIMFLFVAFIFKMLLPPGDKGNSINPNVKERGLLYYTCCLFVWTAMIGFVYFLEVMGIVHGFMAQYVQESSLLSPLGVVSLVSDAALNVPLYLIIIYRIDNGLDCRNVVILWCGNMLHVFGLIVAETSGEYGKTMNSASLIMIAYIVLPVYFGLQFLNQPRHFTKEVKASTYRGLLHIFLAISLCVVMVFGLVRGLAALGSPLPIASYYASNVEPYLTHPDKLAAMWVAALMWVGSFIQVALIFGLFHPGSEWMLDWSLIYSGMTIYGTVLMSSEFTTLMDAKYQPPDGATLIAIAGNLFIPVVAVAVAFACFSQPDYFRQPYKIKD